jgi:hypothetical protein
VATVAELLVKISGDSKNLQKELSASQRNIRRAFGPEAMDVSKDASMALAGVAAAITAAGAAAMKAAANWAVAVDDLSDISGMSGEAASKLLGLGQMVGLSGEQMSGALVKMSKSAQDAFESIQENGANSTDAFTRFGVAIQDSNGVMLSSEQIFANVAARHRELADGVQKTAMEVAIFGRSGAVMHDMLNLTEEQMAQLTATVERMGLAIGSDSAGAFEQVTRDVNKAKLGFTALGNAAFQEVLPALSSAASGVATFMAQFAVVTKEQGITTALRNLIPKELQLGIFAVAGALTAVAIPAMNMWAISAVKAAAALVISFGPAVAAGLAIGAIAYVIWAAWEPLSDLMVSAWDGITDALTNAWDVCMTKTMASVDAIMQFVAPIVPYVTAAWDTISGWALQAWDYVVSIVGSAVNKILDFISPLTNLIGKVWDSVGVKTDEVRASIANVGSALDKVAGAAGVTGAALGTGAKGAAKAYDDLAKAAEQAHKEIYREWVQLTKSQMEQLDIWRKDEDDKLEKSRAANARYEQDKTMLAETYSARRKKIMEDEFNRVTALQRSAQDTVTGNQNRAAGIGLTGVDKQAFDLQTGMESEITAVTRKYQDMVTEFGTLDAAAKANNIKAWQDAGLAFKVNADGTVDFAEQAEKDKWLIRQDYAQKYKDLEYGRVKFQEQLEKAHHDGDIAAFTALLNDKRAIEAQDLAGRQSMIDSYYTVWQEAHRTSMDYMAEATNTMYGGLKTTFADIFTGAQSVGEAFGALGQTVLNMLADWAAQWVASRTMLGLLGESFEQLEQNKIAGTIAANAAKTTAAIAGIAKQTAAVTAAYTTQTAAATKSMAAIAVASAATAAAMAAAWAPAAAMASLASFGANAAPAMAGITATVALSTALAVPKLASGGITTGRTLAEIGERGKEAVLPLDRRVFERMGLTSGSGTTNQVTQNIYGNINTKADTEEIMDDLGQMVQNAIWGAV